VSTAIAAGTLGALIAKRPALAAPYARRGVMGGGAVGMLLPPDVEVSFPWREAEEEPGRGWAQLQAILAECQDAG